MDKRREIFKRICVYAGMALTLYLFYRSMWVLTLLLPCMIIYEKVNRRRRKEKLKLVLNRQFKDLMDSLAASVRAGYSVENALKEALKEMKVMHGEDSPIYSELNIMLNRMAMGITAEQAFDEFAQRCGTEDIKAFASVFGIAKRSGGDMAAIVRKTAADISSRIETRNEIEVVISSKKLEMNIMSLIPLGMILYIELTSGGLLEPLYGNPGGTVIMTACLIVYAGAAMLGRKITDIRV